MGIFVDLKKMADKEIKYKQGIHIKQAHANGCMSEAEFATTNDGMCAALVMNWLSEMLYYDSPGCYQRGEGVHTKDLTQNHAIAGMYAQVFLQFSKDWDSGAQVTAVENMARSQALRAITAARKSSDGDNKFVAFMVDLEANLPEGTGIFIAYWFTQAAWKKGNYGHAIGLCRTKSGLRFFDPNIGAYKIKTGKHDYWGFVSKYELLKLNTVTGAWQIYAAVGVPIQTPTSCTPHSNKNVQLPRM
jgi:hypothetical protein